MASLLDKLTDAVRSGEVKKKVERSAGWFKDKLKGLKGELRNRISRTNPSEFYRTADNKINSDAFKRKVNLGDMFCYYYDPKYAKTLPYYDQFPLIMLIGAEEDTFLGINFHYLAPRFRAQLLDRINAKEGVINWKKVSGISMIEPTVKRYRFDHIASRIVPIEKEEEEITIFLPLEKFRKASKSTVWGDSKRRFR